MKKSYLMSRSLFRKRKDGIYPQPSKGEIFDFVLRKIQPDETEIVDLKIEVSNIEKAPEGVFYAQRSSHAPALITQEIAVTLETK